MTEKKLESQELYEEAKKVFKDADFIDNEHLLIGSYRLVKEISKTENLTTGCASLFDLYQIISKLDKKYSDVSITVLLII